MKTKLMICLLFILITGCNFQSNDTDLKTNIETKDDVELLLEEGNYNELKNFIEDNINNVSKSSLISNTINIMFEREKKGHSMLKELIHNYLTNKKWDEIEKIVKFLETNSKPEAVPRILQHLETYQREQKNAENIKRELENKREELNKLKYKYPDTLPWESIINDNVQNFSGVILQKVNNDEYRVTKNSVNGNNQFILKTFETIYNSTGKFNSHALLSGKTYEYEMDNGFKESFRLLYEVTESNKDLAQKILDTQDSVSIHLERFQEKKEYEAELLKDLERTIDNLFGLEGESLNQNGVDTSASEGLITLKEKDDKIFVNNITRNDTREKLIKEMGRAELIQQNPHYNQNVDIYDYDNIKFHVFEEEVLEIQVTMKTNDFYSEFVEQTTWDKYVSEEGDVIYHKEKGDQLLLVGEESSENINFRIKYADGNFYNAIKSGWTEKVEK